MHGGTSGIGVTAIQLAHAFGAKVITTVGSAEKCEVCRKLGATRAIDYTTEDFVEVVKAETGGRGVDLILDIVGGDYVERNIRSLADDGRLVNIAFQKGSKVTIDLMRVMLKRLTLTGSTLRIRSAEVKAAIARAVEEKVLPLRRRWPRQDRDRSQPFRWPRPPRPTPAWRNATSARSSLSSERPNLRRRPLLPSN